MYTRMLRSLKMSGRASNQFNRHPYTLISAASICMMWCACSGRDNDSTHTDMSAVLDGAAPLDMASDAGITKDGGMTAPDGGALADMSPPVSSSGCDALVVADYYEDAGTTSECTSEAGKRIADSLIDVNGLTIDNDGEDVSPCIRVECDQDYAYVVSNNIPHYDFVVLTPNALTESYGIHRIPLNPTPPEATNATDVAALDGCTGMYEDYIAGTVPSEEPSGLCGTGHLTRTTSVGTNTYAQIECLSQVAVMTNGVVANGPNEGDRGVWGDVGLEPFGTLAQGPGASVDFCGGHTGLSMHYHAAYEACFQKDEQNKPIMSYAVVATEWSQQTLIEGECTEPSGIIAWSFDGYPIKGPCVCTERASDGSCTTVKKARPSWLHTGIKTHTTAPIAELEALEGKACEETSDCCDDDDRMCDFACNYVVTDGDDAGSSVQKMCTFLRHSWCVREHVDMTEQDTSAQNFVYMDMCNGHDGPDGFAYHATGSFPYIQACYRGEPAAQSAAGGGMMGGGDMMGGGAEAAPCAEGQTSGCCGDGTCDGPETSASCSADCP